MIRKTYKVPVEYAMHCDECSAEMVMKQEYESAGKIVYEHVCPVCGHTIMLDKKYPYINFEDKHVMSDTFQNNIFVM